jgi:hypothetical protein
MARKAEKIPVFFYVNNGDDCYYQSISRDIETLLDSCKVMHQSNASMDMSKRLNGIADEDDAIERTRQMLKGWRGEATPEEPIIRRKAFFRGRGKL